MLPELEQLRGYLRNLAREVVERYEGATGNWLGADWTHEDGKDADGDTVYCEGGCPESCCTCSEAKDDAEMAERWAETAMSYFRQRKFGLAAEVAEEVRSLERYWGDAPTWGPWADAMAALTK